MERPLIRKMREDYGYFGGLSALYGVFYAFCLYQNSHGITFIFYTVATIIVALLMMKRINFTLQKNSKRYFIGMVALSIATCLTTDSFFIIFNWIGILLLFAVAMIHQFYNDGQWSFPAYLERLFILFGTAIGSCFYSFRHGFRFLSGAKQGKKRTMFAIIIGLIVSLGLLSIILPLLLSSDMVFAKFFGEILEYININRIIGIGITTVFGFTACYAFFSALSVYNFPMEKQHHRKTYNPIIGITFTSVLAFIYILYCTIQILYLFLGLNKSLPVGVTYSNYAHSGFWELLFVGIINFILVLICKYLFTENKILKVIMTGISACTYIMLISAAYRILIYISQYHLTFLRVLAIWFLLVLALIMTGVIISIFKKNFPLFRYIMATVSICYIVFALCRPNYWIPRYNIAHTEEMDFGQLSYLINNYYEDGASSIAKIDPESINIDSSNYEERDVKGILYDYFAGIAEHNEGIYFRKANYSRIRAKMIADKYLEEHKDYKKYARYYR